MGSQITRVDMFTITTIPLGLGTVHYITNIEEVRTKTPIKVEPGSYIPNYTEDSGIVWKFVSAEDIYPRK